MGKIQKITLENFMSIEKAEIPFPQSNILSLVGLNDSGKSAVTRAIAVLLYNYKASKQASFIMSGKNYFCLQLDFDDGVIYRRYKYSNGNSLYEFEVNGAMAYTNRVADGTLTSVAGIPDIIKEYLGVAVEEETGEYLNVRRNKDKLFLVDTSGGENYKIINYLLKSDELSNASIKLNKDKNALANKCKDSKVAIATLDKQVSSLEEVTDSYLEGLKSNLKVLETLSYKIKDLQNLIGLYTGLKELPSLRKVPTKISIGLFDQLNALSDLQDMHGHLSSLDAVKKVPNKVDNSVLEKIEMLNTLLKDAEEFGKLDANLKKVEKDFKASSKARDKFAVDNNLQTCPNCGDIFIGREVGSNV